MTMSVRAKMQLTSITENSWGAGKSLKFTASYSPEVPEDQRYAKATPSGSLEMLVDNPSALEQFKLGEFYYLDFAPVPKPST
jgi:hypothetical protein